MGSPEGNSVTATLDIIARRGRDAWKPPMFIPLSEWADRYAYLSEESSAVVGKFHCLPYQREIMDAFTNPKVETLTLMKSARVGGTKIIDFAIAYRIHQNPRSMLIVQPTLAAAKRFSKIELKPMFRDTPALHGRIAREKSRDASNTILEKDFVGGTLFIVGANSPTGLSALTVGDVFLDEEDRYSDEAKDEGDPSELAIKRTETYPNRKIIRNSSPGDKRTSKIEPSFLDGDQRYRHVPCPHCGAAHPYIFRSVDGEIGHTFEWPEHQPENAFFRCPECEKEIHEKHKAWMDQNGVWVPRKPFLGHASFFIWAAYSYSANATWGKMAEKFLLSKDDPRKLKVFVNTWLAQTWTSQGDAPDWHRLYERREDYPKNVIPARALVVTAAADVHPDRIEVEIVAWGPGLESWSMDYRVFNGPTDTISSPVWRDLDAMMIEEFPSENGRFLKIARFAIDCGYNTQVVLSWVKRHTFPRVVAFKGSDTERSIVGHLSLTEYTIGGKKIKGGAKHFPVGVSQIKSELYGWLKQPAPTTENPAVPIGFCHFSTAVNNEEYFRQLTAEKLVTETTKAGRYRYQWVKDYKRNEALDVRVYNRALAHQLGVDRWKATGEETAEPAPQRKTAPPPMPSMPARPLPQTRQRRRSSLARRPQRLW